MQVAISGAGVAGAALAHWLYRTGHTPTLIEKAPKFRTGGYMIDFWGVGYQVAKRMGIEDPIRAAGYQIERVRSVGSGGEVKADVERQRLSPRDRRRPHQPAPRRPGRSDLHHHRGQGRNDLRRQHRHHRRAQ